MVVTGREELRRRAFRFLASAEARRDPGDLYRLLLAAEGPLAVGDRCWLVARYDDVAAALADERLTVELDAVDPVLPVAQSGALAGVFSRMLSFRDGDGHARLRRLAAPAFGPRAAAALRPEVESAVDELLEAGLSRGSLDLVADLARPLPVLASCAMLRVPPADRPLLLDWATRLTDQLMRFGQTPAELAEAEAVLAAVVDYVGALRRELGRRPRGGLLDQLLVPAADGRRLDEPDVIAFVVLLLLNGLETATNALANAVWVLLRTPSARAWLHAHPSGAAAAFEECLRLAGPVRLGARRVREAVTVRGCRPEPGDTFALLFAAANRDASRFPEPDAFRPGRPGRHLAFGHGPHVCLGAAIARQQGEVVIDRLFRRCDVESPLTDADAPWKPSLPVLGLASLPLDVRPARSPRCAP